MGLPRRALDQVIERTLLTQEAERRGYSSDGEVQRVRKQMMIQRLNKQLQESIRLSDITDEEIEFTFRNLVGVPDTVQLYSRQARSRRVTMRE